ncbi:hypothetical protein AB0A70_18910 [Streptomyces morookaense]|uniref:hypothetical protein n=1 Tax=Streptomyces morookaense TaxID=1970 RepID=UPI0034087BEB
MADLLTPIIAAISALSGAALTGFIGARSERRKEHALERQQQRQQEAEDRSQVRELRAEHLQWRRERRQTAYEALAEATQRMERAVHEYFCAATLVERDATAVNSAFSDAESALEGVQRAASRVRLEGPDDVAEAAHSCESKADRFLTQVVLVSHLLRSGEADAEAVRTAENRAGAAGETYADDCWEFIVVARKSLDEVMTPE